MTFPLVPPPTEGLLSREELMEQLRQARSNVRAGATLQPTPNPWESADFQGWVLSRRQNRQDQADAEALEEVLPKRGDRLYVNEQGTFTSEKTDFPLYWDPEIDDFSLEPTAIPAVYGMVQRAARGAEREDLEKTFPGTAGLAEYQRQFTELLNKRRENPELSAHSRFAKEQWDERMEELYPSVAQSPELRQHWKFTDENLQTVEIDGQTFTVPTGDDPNYVTVKGPHGELINWNVDPAFGEIVGDSVQAVTDYIPAAILEKARAEGPHILHLFFGFARILISGFGGSIFHSIFLPRGEKIPVNPRTGELLTRATAQQLTQQGIPVDWLDRGEAIDSNWQAIYSQTNEVLRAFGEHFASDPIGALGFRDAGIKEEEFDVIRRAEEAGVRVQDMTPIVQAELIEEKKRVEDLTTNVRRQAYGMWQQGRGDEALKLIDKAHRSEEDLWRRTRLDNPTVAFTWWSQPERREQFMEGWALAELQLGRPMSHQEIRRLRDRYIDLWAEVAGGIPFDLMNVVGLTGLNVFGEAVKGIKRAGKWWAGPTFEILGDTRIGRGIRSFFVEQSVRSRSRTLARDAQNAVLAMTRGADTVIPRTIEGAVDMPVAKGQSVVEIMDRVGRAIKAGDNFESLRDVWNQLPAGFGRREFEVLQQLTRLADGAPEGSLASKLAPDQLGRTFNDLYRTIYRKEFVRQRARALKRAIREFGGQSVDDLSPTARAAVREEAVALAQDIASKPRGVVIEFGELARRAWLDLHTPVKGTQVLDDSLVFKTIRAVVGESATPKAVKLYANSLKRFTDWILRRWIDMTLFVRQAWTSYNMIDSTTRYLTKGGRLFNDLGSILKINPKLWETTVIPADVTGSLMRTIRKIGDEGIQLSEPVAQKYFRGWRAKYSLFSFFFDAGLERAKELGISSVVDLLSKEGGGIIQRIYKALNIPYTAITHGYRDFNAAIEFALRTRLLHDLYHPTFRILDEWHLDEIVRRMNDLGVSEAGQTAVKRAWKYAYDDPEKFRDALLRMMKKEAKAGRTFSLLLPDNIEAINAMGRADREILLRPLIDSAEEFFNTSTIQTMIRKGQLDEVDQELAKFFDEVREDIQWRHRQHVHDEAMKTHRGPHSRMPQELPDEPVEVVDDAVRAAPSSQIDLPDPDLYKVKQQLKNLPDDLTPEEKTAALEALGIEDFDAAALEVEGKIYQPTKANRESGKALTRDLAQKHTLRRQWQKQAHEALQSGDHETWLRNGTRADNLFHALDSIGRVKSVVNRWLVENFLGIPNKTGVIRLDLWNVWDQWDIFAERQMRAWLNEIAQNPTERFDASASEIIERLYRFKFDAAGSTVSGMQILDDAPVPETWRGAWYGYKEVRNAFIRRLFGEDGLKADLGRLLHEPYSPDLMEYIRRVKRGVMETTEGGHMNAAQALHGYERKIERWEPFVVEEPVEEIVEEGQAVAEEIVEGAEQRVIITPPPPRSVWVDPMDFQPPTLEELSVELTDFPVSPQRAADLYANVRTRADAVQELADHHFGELARHDIDTLAQMARDAGHEVPLDYSRVGQEKQLWRLIEDEWRRELDEINEAALKGEKLASPSLSDDDIKNWSQILQMEIDETRKWLSVNKPDYGHDLLSEWRLVTGKDVSQAPLSPQQLADEIIEFRADELRGLFNSLRDAHGWKRAMDDVLEPELAGYGDEVYQKYLDYAPTGSEIPDWQLRGMLSNDEARRLQQLDNEDILKEYQEKISADVEEVRFVLAGSETLKHAPTYGNVGEILPGDFTSEAADIHALLGRGASADMIAEHGDSVYHVGTSRLIDIEGLKPSAVTGRAGLEGDPANLVSVTYDEAHALRIQERLQLAVRAARGEATVEEIVDSYLEWMNFYDLEEFPEDLSAVLFPKGEAPTPDSLREWAEAFVTGEELEPDDALYELVKKFDQDVNAVAEWVSDQTFEMPPDLRAVIFNASREDLALIDPSDIKMYRVGVRRGIRPESTNPLELEWQFRADDLWIAEPHPDVGVSIMREHRQNVVDYLARPIDEIDNEAMQVTVKHEAREMMRDVDQVYFDESREMIFDPEDTFQEHGKWEAFTTMGRPSWWIDVRDRFNPGHKFYKADKFKHWVKKALENIISGNEFDARFTRLNEMQSYLRDVIARNMYEGSYVEEITYAARGATEARTLGRRPPYPHVLEAAGHDADTIERVTRQWQEVGVDNPDAFLRFDYTDADQEYMDAWAMMIESGEINPATAFLDEIPSEFKSSPEVLETFIESHRLEMEAQELLTDEYDDMLEYTIWQVRQWKQALDIFRNPFKGRKQLPQPPVWDMPEYFQTWLFQTQHMMARYSAAMFLVDELEQHLRQLVRTNPELAFKIADDDIAKLDQIAQELVDNKRAAFDSAMFGGDDVPGLGGGQFDGVVSQVNTTMLDYDKYSQFDEVMKQVMPFWMFPSRTIPYWVNYMTENPKVLWYYNAYMRGSRVASWRNGGVTRSGRQLESLVGYIPLGDTGLWINPTAPWSLRMAFPYKLPNQYDEDVPDDAPFLQRVLTNVYETGRMFGFNPAPWFVYPGYWFNVLDKNRYIPYTLIAPMQLVPRWVQRDLQEKLARMHAPSWTHSWLWSPEVHWQDFLIERRMLSNLLTRLQGAPREQHASMIDEVIEALGYEDTGDVLHKLNPREDNQLWVSTRHEIEESEYWRGTAGWFTGIYAKEFTDAEAELYRTRDEINRLKAAINQIALRDIFALDPGEQDFYDYYIDQTYNTPKNWPVLLYGTLGYVRTPEGDKAYDEQRRDLIAKRVHEDIITKEYFDGIKSLGEWLEKQFQPGKIRLGEDSEVEEMIWDEYWTKRTALEDNPRYDQARRTWAIGYKPAEKILEHFEEQFYYMIRETKPRWREDMDFQEWENMVEAWYDSLPRLAKSLGTKFLVTEARKYAGEIPGNRLFIPEDLVSQIVQATDRETYEKWELSRHTAYDALNDAYQELYISKYWDSFSELDTEDPAYSELRELAEREFDATPPSDEELIAWVKEKYGDQFSDRELLTAMNGRDKVHMEERLEADTEQGEIANQIWDWLFMVNPGEEYQQFIKTFTDPAIGGDEDMLTTWYETGGDIAHIDDEELQEKFLDFADDVQNTILRMGLQPPTSTELLERADAKRLNDNFRRGVARALGEDFYAFQSWYYGLNFDERRQVRLTDDRYPLLDKYRKMKEFFAEANQLWAKYYFPEKFGDGLKTGSTSQLTGSSAGGTARSRRTLTRARASGAGSVVESFVPQGRRSTLDPERLLSGKLGTGGVGGIPKWPAGFRQAIGPQAAKEVVALQEDQEPLSDAAANLLERLQRAREEFAEYIASLMEENERVKGGGGSTEQRIL